MKLKYLAPQNCKAILPKFVDTHLLKDFDKFLDELNDYELQKGIVEKLVKRNQRTQSQKVWDRYLYHDIEISFLADYRTGETRWHLQDNIENPENARPKSNQVVNVMFSIVQTNGFRWTFKVPLQYLLKGWGDANEGHQVYVHCIELIPKNDPSSERIKKCYTGITKRNWLKRLDEHLAEVRSGGNKLFHRAWREAIEGKDLVYHSHLQWTNFTYEEAMEWEERYVDIHCLSPKGLNMIPGGFKGLKFLHKHRITDRVGISLEERDKAIARYVKQHPRKGMPNPFISELWQDDEYYLKVISSKEKTLTVEQVHAIRVLAAQGFSIEDITEKVGALSEQQVKNVISGRTYSRIH